MALKSVFERRMVVPGILTGCLGIAGFLWAQTPARPSLPKPNQSTDPILRAFEFRSIGPAVMMGRVDDIQGTEKDPMLLYVGFATGGLWKSTDGGNHWRSQFDNMPNESVGAIGIAPSDPNIVYVGMGEANNRQSSSIGDGVMGTRDGGKTWTHLGLEGSQSIGRIAVDPTNPDVVFLAVMGHLFGQNTERGLYKTTDGGKTWTKSKYIDSDTGFNDVAIDPSNPKIIYASSFQRRRTWWGYNGGGPGSGLWKSTDGGNSWNKLEGPGWPKPKDSIYGRIAISIFRAKPSTIYAQVEAGASPGTGGGTTAEGGPALPGRGGFVQDESAGGNGGVAAGTPEAGGGRGGRGGPPPPDPNGSGVFRSADGGATWTFESNQDQRPTYFSQIRVDPVNDQKLFVGGNPGQMSLDGGKTWKGLTGSHTDYHAFWINPKDPRIVAVGHDGGFDISNDGGYSWDYHNDIAAGQFYQVSADMRHPYNVCGGLQDNNAWCGPSALRSTAGPVNTDWFTVSGGDGFYTRQDPSDWGTVYAESQNGSMTRHDLHAGTQKSIRPTVAPPPAPKENKNPTPANPTATNPTAGSAPAEAAATEVEAPAGGGGGGRGGPPNVVNAQASVPEFRFYWNAPFEISPHNPSVVYMAAQYFFKSINRGDTWRMNPQDLTKNVPRWSPEMPIMNVAGDKPMAEKHDGYAASSLITQVRESPSRPGVIWIGTDDGNLQVSQDGGDTFTQVYGNIKGAPRGYVQIARIEPSHFEPGTAYVALDAHRLDDWAPYLFKTTDFGKTWSSVTGDLPKLGNINALREDLENPDLLFVGTEFGLYVSLDGSRTWKRFMNGMPSVRVDDILIHPRDRDLIIATHGRSIWIADDISPLEHLKKADPSLTLFDPRPAIQWKNDATAQRHVTNRDFVGVNPQGGTAIHILSQADLGDAKVEFLQANKVVGTMDVKIAAGMNRFQWAMRGPVPPGAGRGGRGGRGGEGGGGGAEMVPDSPDAPPVPAPGPGGRGAGPVLVPFVAGGGRGGGGGGGGGGGRGGAAQGPALEPGTYMVRLIAGGQTLQSSVDILEDTWMRNQ
jgi:photosystem II stability/assembly factor-like uncharacterized protein